MSALYLNIKLTGPLLLADGPPAGNLTTSLEFIPGGVLLGVLAHTYLRRHNQQTDPVFRKIFLQGAATFDNGYIQGAQPVPRSARSCKYVEGFAADAADLEKPDNGHGVVDLLLKDSGDIRCPAAGCQKPVDYFDGYCQPDTGATGPQPWIKHKILKRVVTRTAIAPPFGTAAMGKLYSQEVLAEGQEFVARVEVEDAYRKPMEDLLEKPLDACIGRGRSRGQGWVCITRAEKNEPPLPSLDERRSSFLDSKNGMPLLAMTLLSDAIFSDDYFCDLTLPTLEHLIAAGLQLDPGQWEPEPIKAFTDSRLIAGFQGPPWNLPREPRLAIMAGSAIMFKSKVTDPDIRLPNPEGWLRLGERTAEGFGRALLWHPFHLDFKQTEEG